MQHARPQLIPRHGQAFGLGAVAQVARYVMEKGHDLCRLTQSLRQRPFERIDPLVRIEWTKFAAEHGFVIEDDAGAARHVIGQIEGAAEMCVPGEALIYDRRRRGLRPDEPGRVHMEIVTGEKFRAGRCGRDDWLLGGGVSGQRQQQARREHCGAGQ